MNLFIVGGDSRIGFMAEKLAEAGYSVSACGISSARIVQKSLPEGAAEADAVILGMPVSKDGETLFAPFSKSQIALRELTAVLRKDTPVLCGMASDAVQKIFSDAGIMTRDYFAREDTALLNAVPTAEGAIEIAMRKLPVTLWGSECLVTGYGRIGKYLAGVLAALGARVTVSARKEKDFALCRMAGLRCVHTENIDAYVGKCRVIFNTVPHMIFTDKVLSALRPDCLLIDLASLPGGADRQSIAARRTEYVEALSLPGKVAPETAGEILCGAVESILRERN